MERPLPTVSVQDLYSNATTCWSADSLNTYSTYHRGTELLMGALRLSTRGAVRTFGSAVGLAVCVNSVPVEEARRGAGQVPKGVTWLAPGDPPEFLREFLDSMAEGVAWKFSPLRVFPDSYELSLDGDCILWALPQAMKDWLEEDEPRCLVAADVRSALGAFTG